MTWRRRGGLFVYGLIALMAVISLVILFRLRERFEETQAARINDLQRVFSSRELLKGPSDPNIRFYEIEAEVAKYAHRGDFGAIRIAKWINGRDHVIYPFYDPALLAAGLEPEKLLADDRDVSRPNIWQRYINATDVVVLPLESDGQRLGAVSVEVFRGALRTVSLVIWALGVMLATSLTFLATQFRRQEKVLSATTVELEEKRRELVRLERLALAGQLSANILHDLKKPVLNIRNEAAEALNPMAAEATAADTPLSVFGRIREQADFFLSMLKEAGFDRFVRAGEDREYVDVNDLLNRSVALVRYEQGSVEVRRSYSDDLAPVLADPVRLIQVFSNLILNAYQAMDGRGVLEITTVRLPAVVNVEISDSGPGISSEVLSHIFEPFYTTKPPGQGTGLGLYIVRDIVRDLGGEITLDSEPGRTVFRLDLPYTL